jgi:D-arabinose 1-dehydrogenase-like Zn-dependent alcohol dehydrogenase
MVVGHEFVGEVADLETALDAFKEVKRELKL